MSTAALLVSTYNSPDSLALTLGSVLLQSTLPAEVLVADDGSGLATRRLIETWADAFEGRRVRLQHVWHEDRGFRLGAIRNRALAQATAPYVIQVDGDVLLHRHFVRAHLRYARHGRFLCGRRADLTPAMAERLKRGTAFEGTVPAHALAGHVFARYRLPILTPLFLAMYRSSPTKGVFGSNLSYWLADAFRVNGYDEDFHGWGKEDNEFVLRLMNSGVRRRTLLWTGLEYHLPHPESDRSLTIRNAQLLAIARSERRTRCRNGIVREDGRGAEDAA